MSEIEPENPLGGFDLGALMEQAQAMQEQLMSAQAARAEEVVEGHAGGGLVKVTVTGGMEFTGVHIDPKAVDPGDVEMLEDLVLAALHDAVAQVNRMMGEGLEGLGLPALPGMEGLFGSSSTSNADDDE